MTGLSGLLDRYFAALAKGDVGLLPLAGAVRFTENGQDLTLGRGLWRTVEGSAEQRSVWLEDDEAGQVAGWGLVTEAGADVLVGVRLRAEGGLISEVETLVAREPLFGRERFPASLREPSPIMASAGEPANRAALVRVANAYFDGVQDDDAALIPAADDCKRFENGGQTTLNPGGDGFPPPFALGEGLRLGVRDQVARIGFPQIEEIRDRRYPVVDASRGLVLALVVFDHPGQLRGAPFASPWRTPNSMMIWELFGVSGGLIHRIEALLAVLPYGLRPGW